MYIPLIKAFSYALDQLSKFNVPGLPEFQEERQIVFARSDLKGILSKSYLRGSYKPDIIQVKWNVFRTACKFSIAAYQESYQSYICCKSGCDQPVFRWRNILSTVEVKRGGSRGTDKNRNKRSKGKTKEKSVKSIYVGDFWGLQDLEAPGSSKLPQSAPPKMVDEEYSTRSCMSVAFRRLSSHSQQLQLRCAQRRSVIL